MGARKRTAQNAKENSSQKGAAKPPKVVQPEESLVHENSRGSSCVIVVLLVAVLLAGTGVWLYNSEDLGPVLEKLGLAPQFTSSLPSSASEDAPHTSQPPRSTEEKQQTDESAKTAEAPKEKKKERYKHADITNSLDNKIRQDLDKADALLDKGKNNEAMVKYAVILAKHPKSPRAVYGKACALDALAEAERNNKYLEQAIEEMLKVLDLPDVPKALLVEAGKRCANRQTFRGWGFQATKTIQRLLEVYPEDVDLWNSLGVQYLMIQKNEDARSAFKQALSKDPENGFTKVHLGFILKAIDHKYAEAIPYLQEGIQSNASGVMDGRFFVHLGDALHRTGRPSEALEAYEVGANNGVFMSKWQRSLYNVEGLTARPWWTHQQTGQARYFKMLEDNWQTIRDEGLAQMDAKTGAFVLENEDLRETGDWKQFTLYQQGRKNAKNCEKAPRTCAIFDQFVESSGCRRGQVKFSVMHPGVHVWPHVGPTNCRLRAHLGLVVPKGVEIRVVEEKRTWHEGKVFIFDDSFEHEVWHNGDSFRLVLIADIWHPELTAQQKRTLPAI